MFVVKIFSFSQNHKKSYAQKLLYNGLNTLKLFIHDPDHKSKFNATKILCTKYFHTKISLSTTFKNVENHANINFRDKIFVISHGKPTPTCGAAPCSKFL